MADLERRKPYTPRAQREQRAYQLVMAGGTAALVGVVGIVLALVDVIGAGIPLLALVIAAICFVMFRRMVGGR